MVLRRSNPKYNQFRFDTGSLALNFVTTVKHRGSQPMDLLSLPESLPSWFQQAGIFFSPETVTTGDHKEALLLREAIHDTARSLILNQEPKKEDVEFINAAAAVSPAVPQYDLGADLVRWESKYPIKECLAVIARDAIMLMCDNDRKRLRMCDNKKCQMIFLDTSPKNNRRWCSMSICGTRHKVAMLRQRKDMLG